MFRLYLGLALVSLLTFNVVACDDERTPAAPGGGGSIVPPIGGTGGSAGTGPGGAGGAGGASGIGGAGGTTGGGGQGGVGGFENLGACDNAADFAALASFQPSNPRTATAQVAVTECNNIPNQTDFIDCVAAQLRALASESGEALSTDCSLCYGTLAACSIPGGCNVSCAPDSCELICRQCPGYPACESQLDQCTGRTPPECGET